MPSSSSRSNGSTYPHDVTPLSTLPPPLPTLLAPFSGQRYGVGPREYGTPQARQILANAAVSLTATIFIPLPGLVPMESTVRHCQLPAPTYVLCRLSEISLSVPHHNIETNVDIQCGFKGDTCDAQAAQYNICSHSTHLSVPFDLYNTGCKRVAFALCFPMEQRVSLISRVRGNCYGVAITASLRSASSMFDHSVLWYVMCKRPAVMHMVKLPCMRLRPMTLRKGASGVSGVPGNPIKELPTGY